MKILFVEGNEDHRETATIHLRTKKHQVDHYVPKESVSGNWGDVPTFSDENDLTQLLDEEKYDAAILDRETFREGQPERSFLPKYLRSVIESGYKGNIVVTSTMPEDHLSEELAEFRQNITIVQKAYLIEELVSGLEAGYRPKTL